MPPKVMSAVKSAAKMASKVDHKNRVFTYILAQMASPSPPLGSQLGAVGVNIAAFVKDFNLKTSIYKEGVPIPCVITVNPDRSYNLAMSHPPWSYYLKQAAGIQRGAMESTKQVAGKITRKHVYEIAKIKSEDELWQEFDLKDICDTIVDEAYTIGIQVVDHIDAEEYGQFLEERKKIVAQEKADILTAREAKLLRT